MHLVFGFLGHTAPAGRQQYTDKSVQSSVSTSAGTNVGFVKHLLLTPSDDFFLFVSKVIFLKILEHSACLAIPMIVNTSCSEG